MTQCPLLAVIPPGNFLGSSKTHFFTIRQRDIVPFGMEGSSWPIAIALKSKIKVIKTSVYKRYRFFLFSVVWMQYDFFRHFKQPFHTYLEIYIVIAPIERNACYRYSHETK